MDVVRSLALFFVAAVAEIGGAWLVWQGVREHRAIAWIGAGIAALAAYGFVATFQEDPNFGRVLAEVSELTRSGTPVRTGRFIGVDLGVDYRLSAPVAPALAPVLDLDDLAAERPWRCSSGASVDHLSERTPLRGGGGRSPSRRPKADGDIGGLYQRQVDRASPLPHLGDPGDGILAVG